MKDIIFILVTVNGVVSSLSPLLHILEMFRKKDSTGQSFVAVLYGNFLTGCLWLLYGCLFSLLPVIATSSVVVLVGVFYCYTVLKYRRKQ